MSNNASQFVGNIPEYYDRELGPNIFEDYAGDIAKRAVAAKPARVLELAAGTGILTRKLRDAMPKEVPLTVTDLNAPMLDIARKKFNAGENVKFQTADAMSLPFDDGKFDLIVCQFGVMFFPDKVASFREAKRVLAPGGIYLFNTWGTHAENDFSRIAHETVLELFPKDPPGFYRVPFSYADAPPVIADAKAAGFVSVEHDTVAFKKLVKDIGAFAHGLVFGNPLADEVRARGSDPDAVVRAIEARQRKAFGEPPMMPLKANIFTARKAM
jgi:SAM-dependent methyltransferase